MRTANNRLLTYARPAAGLAPESRGVREADENEKDPVNWHPTVADDERRPYDGERAEDARS
jgi:hypothetical protein